jgi:hypothetical protein
MRKGFKLLGVALLTTLFIAASVLAAGASAGKKGTGVKVKARIGGRIVLEIDSGEEITFNVDPVANPEDTAETVLVVRTNVPRYSIVARFGEFKVDDYDLIANGKFFIRSKAPGTGQAIDDWTVPKGQMTIVKGEDGFTNGEKVAVEYKVVVDFTVPPGEAKMQVVFTAVPSL